MKHKIIMLAVASMFTMNAQAGDDLTKKTDDSVKKPVAEKTEKVAGPKLVARSATKLPAPTAEFSATASEIFPMSPNQVRQFSKVVDDQQRAKSDVPGITAKPMTSSIRIDSSPGVTPPVIRLGRGFVSTLVFVDSSGAPWPVTGMSVGNPDKFAIDPATEGDTNVLTMTPLGSYVHSNLSVMLKGRNTPVSFTVVSDQHDLDYRLDISMDERGPNALAPVTSGDVAFKLDAGVRSAIDGVPPKGSAEMKVIGINGQAWMLDGKILLRTKATLLSPAWTDHGVSADGTNVYKIPNIPSLIVSIDGKQVDVTIEGITWQAQKPH